ncbi:Serine hydrolase FSH [Penicillium atrosanguineum]|uniref:Serine hydrolase FSH n=1 Tax=Penicillium atrosanguineum TaxID=1132637 RepID=A0A9W9KWC7_9EURO|nr:Serine hydrolase FSH [Penicillium atrosanguineum]KAJ5141669.1 Serine hydrolase FSH [Penicillium atrosanguineum]KAJ5321472.1 Serine hydrolase FSH [Penicillium atrosanguineum]
MRFLCLHGAGTNGEVRTFDRDNFNANPRHQIFEIQTGGIRQQLEKKGHIFKFVNGKMDAAVESELEGVVDGPFYNHYPRSPAVPSAHLKEAFEHVLNIIATEGPFDAVMGFSQGAALASALIAHQAKAHPEQPSLFRAAVFICGGAPWEGAGLNYIASQPDTYAINIPTANIVGKIDPLYPESMKLYQLCEPSKAAFYDHGSKHMVPFDMKNTEEMVRVIEETVAKAIRG